MLRGSLDFGGGLCMFLKQRSLFEGWIGYLSASIEVN